MENKYLQEAKALAPWLEEIFKHLHRHPELSNQDYETQKFIMAELEKMGIEAVPCADTGVVGIIRGGKPGKTVGFRADMDALPVEEATDLPYKSQKPGVMHACGHDSHMTILLGMAKIMNEKKEELAGNIKLFFQPAEEKDGGAKRMVEAGCLENPKVDAVFFSHCSATLPVGKIHVRSGATSAASDKFTVTFKGVGCHGAYPHRGVDPVVAACQVVVALQTISSRRNNPADPVVVTVGSIHAGSAGNVIPATCEICGTIRTINPNTRKRVHEDLKQIITGVAGAMGVETDIFIKLGYCATICDDEMVALTREAGEKVLGAENVLKHPETSMGAEDFAYFCEAVPGCNFRYGVNSEKTGKATAHNPAFMVDLDALPHGAAVYAQIADDFLNGN